MATVAGLLGGAGIDAREARLLLSAASGVANALIAAFPEREVEAQAAARFVEMARRRAAGEPVAYILGVREFYGREFRVGPDVLIPRHETELLVELALERMARDKPLHALDLGTGSGAIAVTLACEVPGLTMTAVDLSEAALRVARDNASRLAPRADVRFAQGRWFEPLGEARFDLIVSNPPYVAAGDPHLSQGDLRFEPRGALAAGVGGLDDLRIIIGEAPRHLAPGAWLLLEHGHDQGAACRELLAAAGLETPQTWRDLAGLDRVSGARATGDR